MKLPTECALCGWDRGNDVGRIPGLFFCLPPKNQMVYVCEECVVSIAELARPQAAHRFSD